MSEVKIIKEQELLGKQFKMYGTTENPLFKANDVAEWIEHSNPSKMLMAIDEDEKIKLTIGTLTNSYTALFLTEDGLYEVLMQSRKPIAKQFKKAVKNILKTIRKTGGYVSNIEAFISTYLPYADDNTKNMFRLQMQTIEQQNTIIEQQKPLVDYAKTVQGMDTNILIRQCSKLASNYITVDIGEKGLYEKLRQWGFVCKTQNEPTKLAYQQKILEFVQNGYHYEHDEKIVNYTCKVTPKGQIYIINRLIKEFNMEVSA